MRVLCLVSTLLFLGGSDAAFASSATETLKAAAKKGKYTYVMFYRASDAATKSMQSLVKQQVEKTPTNTSWVQVNVADPTAAALVKKYDASRLAMPAVVGVAPNGAVTGVFSLKVSQQQLSNAVLTPRYSEMVKKLQEQKVTLVCLQPATGGYVPADVTQLEADAHLKKHVVRVTAMANDAAEARFFQRMKVRTDIKTPVVLMFAPPGVYLGKFDASVSGQQLATLIHKSGRCSCEACRHNHKTTTR